MQHVLYSAAVSNAGGLGMFAMSWRDQDEIQRTIRETHQLTDRPFGVNLVLAWQQLERLKVCLEEGVKIISLSWGDPTPYVDIAHSAGAVVIQTVANLRSCTTVRNRVSSSRLN